MKSEIRETSENQFKICAAAGNNLMQDLIDYWNRMFKDTYIFTLYIEEDEYSNNDAVLHIENVNNGRLMRYIVEHKYRAFNRRHLEKVYNNELLLEKSKYLFLNQRANDLDIDGIMYINTLIDGTNIVFKWKANWEYFNLRPTKRTCPIKSCGDDNTEKDKTVYMLSTNAEYCRIYYI